MATKDPRSSYTYLMATARARAAMAASWACNAEAHEIAGDESSATRCRNLAAYYESMAADYRRWALGATDAPPNQAEATPGPVLALIEAQLGAGKVLAAVEDLAESAHAYRHRPEPDGTREAATERVLAKRRLDTALSRFRAAP